RSVESVKRRRLLRTGQRFAGEGRGRAWISAGGGTLWRARHHLEAPNDHVSDDPKGKDLESSEEEDHRQGAELIDHNHIAHCTQETQREQGERRGQEETQRL